MALSREYIFGEEGHSCEGGAIFHAIIWKAIRNQIKKKSTESKEQR